MKKLSYLFALIAVLLGYNNAKAADTETKSPYSYDFNLVGFDNTASLEHTWAPPGWGHNVDSYKGSYVNYMYMSGNGVDGSGAVTIYSQTLSGGWYDWYSATDMLVTPLVSGTVTLQVKSTGWGDVQFYDVYEKDGAYKYDNQITDTTMSAALTTTDFATITINAGDSARHIGIRGNNVVIDNFTATSATLDMKPALSTRKVIQEGNGQADADADGNFHAHFKAVVVNTGLTDLNSGDTGYSLSLLKSTDSTEVAQIPITKTLKPNDIDTVDVDKVLSLTDYPDGQTYSFLMRENVTNTIVSAGQLTPVAYVSKFVVHKFSYDPTAIADNTSIDFGMQTKAATNIYALENQGAKPLKITSVSIPDGFIVTPKNAFTLAAHQTDTLSITLDASTTGEKKGLLTIKMDDLPDFHLNLSGDVVDSTKWFANFEEGKVPAGMIAEGSNWYVDDYPNQIQMGGNHYSVTRYSGVSTTEKLISPKLHAAQGESLQFMASKVDDTSLLYVYYSKDRKHWALLHTVGSADSIPEAFRFTEDKITSQWSENYAFKTFTVSDIPEGDGYVAFAGTNFHLDNIYGFNVVPVTHDMFVSALKVGSSLTVNSKTSISATITNASSNAEEGSKYTAKLFVGSQSYEAETKDISSGESQSYAFSVTPHEAGTIPAYVVVNTTDGYEAASDTSYLTISAESATAVHQVGTPNSQYTSNQSLLNPYNHYTEAVAVYKASDINLPAGTVIRGLTLRGYNDEDFDITAQYYMRSTDKTTMDGATAATEIADTTNFTRLFAGVQTLKKAGAMSGWTLSEGGDVMHLTFAEPFTYDGGNLEIAVGSYSAPSKQIPWEMTSTSGQAASRSSDYGNYNSFGDMNLPVIYFDIESTPVQMSGTVTSKTTSQPLAGVEVKLVKDDVEYSATTDADGKYTMPVIQNSLTYQLQVKKNGYMPYIEDGYTISADTTVNVAMADANGFFVESKNIPEAGMVNYSYTATTKALNAEASDINADAYTATLFFGDEAVAKAESKAVKAGEETEFRFTFTPHKAGQFQAYVKFAYGEKVSTSDTATVTVAEESATKTVRVNKPTGMEMYIPFNFYDNNSQSEVVYTADRIGLAKGTKITKISFRGLINPSQTPIDAHMYAYIANTTDDGVASTGSTIVDTTSMTKIVSDSLITFSEGKGSFDAPEVVFSFDIPGGFIYDGTNLRLVFRNDADWWTRVYYEYDNTVDSKYSTERHGTNPLDQATFSNSTVGQPVVYLDVETTAEVSGTVTNKSGHAVANAAVTLSNGDVLYTGTTDAEGKYDIAVKQFGKVYDLAVTADGYYPSVKEAAVDFSNGTVVVANDTIVKKVAATGTVSGVNLVNGTTETAPLAGATITVSDESGTVVATITSATDGTYTVDSLKEGTTYTFRFTAAGYKENTSTVAATDTDLTVNATLESDEVTGINGINSNVKTATGNVYTLGGKLVGRNVNMSTLPSGVYIVDGKKVVVR